MSKNKRIREIENRVFKLPERGTSKLYIEDDVESALLQKVQAIVQLGKKYDDLNPVEITLFDNISKIMWFRAIDIFSQIVGGLASKGDKYLQNVFDMWLCYFIHEAITGLNQMYLEQTIMEQKGKSWKKKDKELAEALGPEGWIRPFTTERFEAYISDFIERGLRPEVRAKLKKERGKP